MHIDNTSTTSLSSLLFVFRMKRGALILEDGTEYGGFVFGAATDTAGEVGRFLRLDLLNYIG